MEQHKAKFSPLSIRERIVVKLTIFLIQMIHPWEFSHQYTKFWESIMEDVDLKIEGIEK